MIACNRRPRLAALLAVGLFASFAFVHGQADTPKSEAKTETKAKDEKASKPEFPSLEEVTKGYEKVVSTADSTAPLLPLWVDKKNGRVLAQLPKDYLKKKYFIALTVSSGERYAGLHAGELYVCWKRYGNTLALLEKQVDIRSTGDKESKSSVERLFTDQLIADTPILTVLPKDEGVVISLDYLFVSQADKFFGPLNQADKQAMSKLRAVKAAKALPKNVEVAFELPFPSDGGVLKTLHYSISEMPDDTGYKPRAADDRVGYFTTGYDDLGKSKRSETRTRFINRWHLEKADPSLKLSPPKQPIVFYIEHTTPIRYRHYVKEGILYWNKAFEKVGLLDAIVVYQQDETTGAHMDKDPEDVRYNFVRWLNNNIGTAIGPSRVHPLTGQILDADIILTDGWIRHFDQQFFEILPQLATEGMTPETFAWLEDRPMWDPRLALAPAADRTRYLNAFARGHRPDLSTFQPQSEVEALLGRNARTGYCQAANSKGLDLSLLLSTESLRAADENGDKPKPKDDGEEKVDGIPTRFIGPLLADLVAHEVGHTLGLRHNFAASGLYSLAEINSDKVKGNKPFAASVMDYLPINIDMKDGQVQGDYAMIGVGPYDMWAIEYGYTLEKDLKPILAKSALPEHRFATDQDTMGADPLARRYDFTTDPLDYAKNQMKLAEYHRARLVEKFVPEGESWAKARSQYLMTLSLQTRSLSMMANWIGGAHLRREHRGDGKLPPVSPVSATQQRAALKWVIDNAFTDKSFGLTPELIRHLKHDTLAADESYDRAEDGPFPVHDRVMGIQSSVLTMLMNPTTLRRVYDNELMIESDKDAFTIPEMLGTLYAAVWSELDKKPNGEFTARKPMITSTRRNLQRTYVERLIDLAVNGAGNGAASKPIATLAMQQLRLLNDKLTGLLKGNGNLDPYTRAHLTDAQVRVSKVLDGQYVLNAADLGGGRPGISNRPGAQWERCMMPGCQHCAPTSPSWNEPRPRR